MMCHTNYTQTIKCWKIIYAIENINFYSYVLKIHNIDSKPICDLQAQGQQHQVLDT
jgi:hypothetical protein